MKTTKNYNHILIYGMGMMGTSLALSLRDKNANIQITGVVKTSKSARVLKKKIPELRVIIQNKSKEIAELSFEAYDLVIFALPIQSLISLIPHIPPTHTILTDMSSTQIEVQNAFLKLRPELKFFSSHPICGTENQGPSAAQKNLFQNKLCLLSRPSSNFKKKLQTKASLMYIKKFWESIDMKTYIIPAELHDEALGFLSHAPHVLSASLSISASRNPIVKKIHKKSPLPPIGGGFRDMTRIAGSNPDMWVSIFTSNSKNIERALREFIVTCSYFLEILCENKELSDLQRKTKLKAWLIKARQAKEKLCPKL